MKDYLPFGKYKDKLINDIASKDPDYLYWLIDQDWFCEKFTVLYQAIIDLLGLSQEIEMSRPVNKIIERIKEALNYRGYSDNEVEQMIKKILNCQDVKSK